MGRTRGYNPKATQLAAQPPNQDQQPNIVEAIFEPGDPSMTPERVAALQPVPEDHLDDFPDDPPSKPYDPNDGMYEWAKPEAWFKDRDSEGRTMWRNLFISFTTYLTPPGVKDAEGNQNIWHQRDQQRTV